MGLGYIGIYLCRKNLSVATPMLIEAGLAPDKATAGLIASWANVAYMTGKLASGPIVDRWGGRSGYLGSLCGVALFGALGAFVPGFWALAVVYSLNRLTGAAGWTAMMKLTSTWFPPRQLGTAIAGLSLSYILGGIAATYLAGWVVTWSHDWRMVMGFPSVLLLGLILVAFAFVRQGPLNERPADEADAPGPATAGLAPLPSQSFAARVSRLLRRPQYVTILVLSFTLTLLRDGLGQWNVDFLKSIQPGTADLAAAAFGSVWFDIAGFIPIVLMGILWDRLRPEARRWVITGILALLTLTLAALTTVSKANPALALPLLFSTGLLLYAPYSVLAGVVSVESGGTEMAGTATGLADAVGYAAAILAGWAFGKVLDTGGYPLAFQILAGLTLISTAAAAIGLRSRPLVEA